MKKLNFKITEVNFWHMIGFCVGAFFFVLCAIGEIVAFYRLTVVPEAEIRQIESLLLWEAFLLAAGLGIFGTVAWHNYRMAQLLDRVETARKHWLEYTGDDDEEDRRRKRNYERLQKLLE